jgi:hypothetical protein
MKLLSAMVVYAASGVICAIAAPSAPAEPGGKAIENDCEHFLGKWKSETFDPDGNYTNIQTAIYRLDGKLQLLVTVRSEDGTLRKGSPVYRNWYCDGNVYITRNDPVAEDPRRKNGARFKVYQLLETSKNLIRYRVIVGDSPGIIHTLERAGE